MSYLTLPILASVPAGVPFLPFVGTGHYNDPGEYDPGEDWWHARPDLLADVSCGPPVTVPLPLGATESSIYYFIRIWCLKENRPEPTAWMPFYVVPNSPAFYGILDAIFSTWGTAYPVDVARASYDGSSYRDWFFVTWSRVGATECPVYGVSSTRAPTMQHVIDPGAFFEVREAHGQKYRATRPGSPTNYQEGGLTGWKSKPGQISDQMIVAEPYLGTGPTDLSADAPDWVRNAKARGDGVIIVPPSGWTPSDDLRHWYAKKIGGELHGYATRSVGDAAKYAPADGPVSGFVLYDPAAGWSGGSASSKIVPVALGLGALGLGYWYLMRRTR